MCLCILLTRQHIFKTYSFNIVIHIMTNASLHISTSIEHGVPNHKIDIIFAISNSQP